MTDAATTLLTKAKGKKTGKTSVAPEAEADLIATTATELENMTWEEACTLVPHLADTVDFSYFKLGGVLAVIQGNDWWKNDGYDSFKACIEDRFGIQYRKAMYLIGIYGKLVESGVPYSEVAGIGWSKLKEIAPIITIDNVGVWRDRAENLTVLQLHEAVKEAQAGTLQKSDETPDAATGVTTFTVKVHPDQKTMINEAVEKAKKEANTEFGGVALEAICMNYLSGAKVAPPVTLKQMFHKHTYEEVLQAFAEQWPDIELHVTA